MICPKCNQEVKEGSKFCENCGAAIEQPGNGVESGMVSAGQPGNGMESGMASAGRYYAQPGAQVYAKTEDKASKKYIFIGAAAVLVVLVAVIAAVMMHKTKIDLSEYATVDFSGYDSYGTASIHMDTGELEEEMFDAADIDTDKLEDLDSLEDLLESEGLKEAGALYELYGTLKWELDKTSGLKNGDTVKVSFEYDNEKAKKFGIKFVGEKKEFKVSGLGKIREVDPFEGLKVEFSGTGPQAYASLEKESEEEYLQSVTFEASPQEGLSVGDTVKVTAKYDAEALTETYGCKLTATEKEYTVEGIDSYITAASDIGEELLNQMKSQTEDTIKSYFAGEKDSLKYSGLNYEGYYFLCQKEPDSWNASNKAYIVYSASVKSTGKEFKETKVYLPVCFSNLIKYADGTEYVDLNSTSIEGNNTGLSYGWWGSVKGYAKTDDMKNELVTSMKASYTDEAVDGLD